MANNTTYTQEDLDQAKREAAEKALAEAAQKAEHDKQVAEQAIADHKAKEEEMRQIRQKAIDDAKASQEPVPAKPKTNKEEESMEKKFDYKKGLIFLAIIALILIFAAWMTDRLTPKNVSIDNISSAQAQTAYTDTSNQTSTGYYTPEVSVNNGYLLDEDYLRLQNDYAGVLVTADKSQTVWYAQTGKTKTRTLHGFVPEGKILAIDSNVLKLPGEPKYIDGAIRLMAGPLDLESYPIVLTDGSAQLVDPDKAQAFLDHNMAVKFARGDFDKDKGQYTYKRWDLNPKQVWVMGYEWNPLFGKLNAHNDNYPL